MSALPYQPVPTIAQRRALAADHAKRYRDVQAMADFHAARLRYEERQPEPCQFCAVEDEADEYPLPLFFAICIGALGLWGATAYATWWLVGTFLGVN